MRFPASPLFLEGLLLLLLAAVAAFGPRLPIVLAAFLLVADTVVAFALGGQFAPAALVVRALLVVHLVRSWKRVGES